MKKPVLISMICMTATALAFGQGTVNFSNLSTALSSPPDRLVRFAAGPVYPEGTPASTNVYRGLVAQLFYGTSTSPEGSLIPVSTAPSTLRSSTSASAGTWFGNGTRTLNGFNPGDVVNLQVRVWDIRAGADYFLAVQQPDYFSLNGPGVLNYFGLSLIFQYTIPTNPTPAPSEFNMSTFQGFKIYTIPEPSVVALALLSGATLLGIRRRK